MKILSLLKCPILSFTCLCFDLALVVGENNKHASNAANSMTKPQPYPPPQIAEKYFLWQVPAVLHNVRWTNVFQ